MCFLGSEPENKDTVNRLISTFGTNNGMDNNRRNYKLLTVLLLIRDITSQRYPLSRKERVILIKYLPPEIN